MSKVAYISAGSTTRVDDGPGRLFGIWYDPVAGSSLVVADNPDLGASGPNFNALTSITSTIAFLGVQPTTGLVLDLDAHAFEYQNALTVSASSSARVTVFYQ